MSFKENDKIQVRGRKKNIKIYVISYLSIISNLRSDTKVKIDILKDLQQIINLPIEKLRILVLTIL